MAETPSVVIEQAQVEDVPAEMRAAFEAAKLQHPDLYVLRTPTDVGDITVICKRPTRALYRKFREDQESGPLKAAHRFEALFLACVVVPSPKDMDTILDRAPACADYFGTQLWDKVVGANPASIKKA